MADYIRKLEAKNAEMLKAHINEYKWLLQLWRDGFINEKTNIFNDFITKKKAIIEDSAEKY